MRHLLLPTPLLPPSTWPGPARRPSTPPATLYPPLGACRPPRRVWQAAPSPHGKPTRRPFPRPTVPTAATAWSKAAAAAGRASPTRASRRTGRRRRRMRTVLDGYWYCCRSVESPTTTPAAGAPRDACRSGCARAAVVAGAAAATPASGPENHFWERPLWMPPPSCCPSFSCCHRFLRYHRYQQQKQVERKRTV